jgi:hypothetical protein
MSNMKDNTSHSAGRPHPMCTGRMILLKHVHETRSYLALPTIQLFKEHQESGLRLNSTTGCLT